MKKNVKISVRFKKFGHGFINVEVSDYDQWNPTQTSYKDYELEPENYTVTYDTVTGEGGEIIVEDSATGKVLAQTELKAGKDDGILTFAI